MRPVNVEIDPSGRASCKGCNKPIGKGELRMKEVTDIPTTGEPSDFVRSDYYHLLHAAERKPRELKMALAKFKGEVPDRSQLMSVATQLIEELDTFSKNTNWQNNDRGNRVISGAGWTLTVFEKGDDWNWVFDGDPMGIFSSLVGKQPQKAPAPSKKRPKSQFGPGFFATQSDATDDLWLFLRTSAAGPAS